MLYNIHSSRLYTSIFLYILLSFNLLYTCTTSHSDVVSTVSNMKKSLQKASCCNYNNHSFELFHCILNQTNKKIILQSNQKDLIIFVTYATDSILAYASYSIAINSFYCKLYSYKFHVVNSSDHIEYETSLDPRWNKIHILKESLTSWAMNAKYIFWLDSDLSIINYHFDFRTLLEKYDYADMLMSKDIDTAPFVSNSGTIIIKNTNWTLNMLDLWWNSYDRVKCCDQNAFTWLYDRNVPIDIRSKVVLLPVHAINTNFPAWKNQLEYHSILHLAGLTSLYRIPVFRKGFTEICNHIDHITINNDNNNTIDIVLDEFKNTLPLQLGLSKEFLFSTMKQLNTFRYHALDRLFHKLPYTITTTTATNTTSTIQSLPNETEEEPQHSIVNHNLSNQLNYSFRYLPNNHIYLLVSEYSIQGHRKELEDIMKFDDDEKEYFPEIPTITLRNKELIIREWIFWQLYDYTRKNLINLNTIKGDNIINGDDNDIIIHNLKQGLNIYESVKETCSVGFEYVISIKISYIATNKIDINTKNEFNKQNDIVSKNIFTSRCQFILNHVIDLINIVIKQSNLPTMLKGMFHYYLFKSYQLLAGSYQIESFISYNKYESIKWLKLASIEWQRMVEHNYYSSNYVLADPEKEYSTVLSELAMLYCLTDQHYNGLITYNTSIHLQHHTIEGYTYIRIATEDVIKLARVILVETYINAGICCIEYENNSYINDAKYFFYQAIDIMKTFSINNNKMSSIIQDYTTKLLTMSSDNYNNNLLNQNSEITITDNSIQLNTQSINNTEHNNINNTTINNNNNNNNNKNKILPGQTIKSDIIQRDTSTVNILDTHNNNNIHKEMKIKKGKIIKKKMKRRMKS